MLSSQNMTNHFDNLPIEVLLVMFSYLNPESIAAASSLNKKFKVAAKDNSLWEEKFKRHFPHVFNKLHPQSVINWYDEFCETYEEQYRVYDEKSKVYTALSTHIRKLFSFVKEGDVESLEGILKLKDLDQTDINGVSLLDWAKKSNSQALLNCFYKIALKEYELNKNTVDITKMDANKSTILHWAILCHQPASTIDLLILQGADINALAGDGHNALRLSAEEGQAEIAELLITHHHADINARGGMGATALLFAIEHSHKNVVDVLLKHNADITIPLQTSGTYHDKFGVKAGDTPLHAASKLGSTAIVRRLLKRNANIEVFNNQHQTPVDVAKKDTLFANELKLLDISVKVNRLPDNYRKVFSPLGYPFFEYGCNAKQLKDATDALKSVVFEGKNKSCLDAHKYALKSDELKPIYRSLRI